MENTMSARRIKQKLDGIFSESLFSSKTNCCKRNNINRSQEYLIRLVLIGEYL